MEERGRGFGGLGGLKFGGWRNSEVLAAFLGGF